MILPGGLVCLVPEAAERGPLNVTLRLPEATTKGSYLGARVGDKVRARDSTLELCDRYKIAFQYSRVYSPGLELRASMLEDSEIALNLEVMRKTALRFGKMAGLGDLLALLTPGKTASRARNLNIYASAAIHRIVEAEEAFLLEDATLMNHAVSELVGLGPGLTPSSDDMLSGLVLLCSLYSRNRGSHRDASRMVSQAVEAGSRGKTTRLSEEFLRQAALGMGNEPVMRLCGASLTAGREAVSRETKRILALGETSGTDIVLGVALGGMLCTRGRIGLASRGSH